MGVFVGVGVAASTVKMFPNSEVVLLTVAVEVRTVPGLTPPGRGIVNRNRFVVSVPTPAGGG